MIFARSPYIVTIDELAQESTRLELFLWNGTGAAPAAPTYSLSKKIPSSNQTETFYNIAPFIREFFNFSQSSPVVTNSDDLTNDYAYCNVEWNTYYTLGGVESLIDTFTDKAFDGFGYYENGYNFAGQQILLTDLSNYGGANVYYYPCDVDPEGFTIVTGAAGTNNYWQVVYTNLETGSTQSFNIGVDSVVNVIKVWASWISQGNKVEILDADESIVGTYYFVPQCECKYDVVTIDFINRWGGWQREFFFKASTENVEMENNKYKLNPLVFPAYQSNEGQYKNFNTNAKRTIKANTGWVNENYKQVIEELLLSETIRVNYSGRPFPAVLKTKSIEKFKNINTKTINYQMEFEMAYDVINSIS
jgi:hypothetical protein